MRLLMKLLVAVLVASPAGLAVAHEHAQNHEHEGCCCRHGQQHDSAHAGAKGTSDKSPAAKDGAQTSENKTVKSPPAAEKGSEPTQK